MTTSPRQSRASDFLEYFFAQPFWTPSHSYKIVGRLDNPTYLTTIVP
jgi:hypothetical protein